MLPRVCAFPQLCFRSCPFFKVLCGAVEGRASYPSTRAAMPAASAPACIVVTGIQGCGKTTMVNAFVESLLPDSARDPRALEATTTTDVLETCRLEGPPRARGSPAARVAGFAPSHEQISAQERDAMVADPRGRAAAARLARGVLPVGLTTRVTTRVVAAPRDAAFAARVSVTYAAEAEIHSLLQRARLAHGQSRGPPLSVNDEDAEATDADASSESSAESSSSGAPRVAPTASLTTRDLHRVAAVLGVRPRDVPTALRDGSKPYLPTRFVALLGRTRVCEFFATNKQTERPAKKRKRGRPRKNEERGGGETRDVETSTDLTPAVVDAVRAYLCRVAHGDWSRWGTIAGDVVVELPMTTKAGIEIAVCDVPGAPRTGSPWQNAHSRAHLVRTLGSRPLDALVSVCDGSFGPSRELRGAMRESGALDTMVSDDGGGVLVLAWPLDKIASHDPSVTLDPNAYAAMQTKLAERGQVSDAGDDDSASDHNRDTHDEDDEDSDDSDDSDDVDSGLDSGTARRPRLLSRGGCDESWTRCLARAAGRNGGVVRGAMSSQPVHTFFGAVEPEASCGSGSSTPKRGGRAFRDSFASLAGYLVERAGDALERRRRSCDEGDEDEDDDDERRRSKAKAKAKAAVIDVARGNGTGIDDAENPSAPRAPPPPPPSLPPPPPPATAASRLTAREPLRDVSAERGRNAECSLKPPVLLKPRRGASGARRMGPLEAAARRAGGTAAGRGAQAPSERRVRFTSSVLGGTSADDGGGEEVGKEVAVAKDERAGNRPRQDLFSRDARVVPWWERKL